MTSTTYERIITRLRAGGWHPGPEFGPDYHKLASRVSELNAKGWNILTRPSRTCKTESGRPLQEYRLGSIV